MDNNNDKKPNFGLSAIIIFVTVVILYMLLDSFILTPVIEWIKSF